MTFSTVAKGVTAIVAVTLMVEMLELSSLAGDRRAARAGRASLITETMEPELPVASEVENGNPTENATLTF